MSGEIFCRKVRQGTKLFLKGSSDGVKDLSEKKRSNQRAQAIDGRINLGRKKRSRRAKLQSGRSDHGGSRGWLDDYQ